MSNVTLESLDAKVNHLMENFAHLRQRTTTVVDKLHEQDTTLVLVKNSLESTTISMQNIHDRLKVLELESTKKAGVSGFLKFVMTIPGVFTVIAAIVLGGAVQDLLIDVLKKHH